ncbi:sugar nucleotide-binding protein [Candidatus Kaiserbacteria bacterium]|nr:sugar nucleotide-binding protein [Candidatus Kaiserbacteria bacterium]
MGNVLVTGSSGLLGKQVMVLDAQLIAPTHAEMDITDLASVERAFETYQPEIVLHLAAATKPPEHEKHPELGIVANIIGTANIARACVTRGIRLVYTSTDYLYTGTGPHKEDEPVRAPYNFAWSKLGGEASVALVPNHLILRLSFGPVPFPWEHVYAGQFNSKLYVDEMAPLVLAVAKSAETGIMNVGGPKTSLEAYARRTKPGITRIPKPDWVPEDTSLDTSKMCQVLGISDPASVLKHGTHS